MLCWIARLAGIKFGDRDRGSRRRSLPLGELGLCRPLALEPLEERTLLSSAPPVAADLAPGAGAVSEEAQSATIYYVNDASTDYDAWCTGLGDDANDGLTPATPKATVQAVLSTYDLEPGDVVRVDTGTYVLTSNIEVTAADQGDSTAPVTFEASPYGVTLDRNNTDWDSYVWHLNRAHYVTITTATSTKYPSAAQSWMKLTGAYWGVYADRGQDALINRLEVCSNAAGGIYARYTIDATFSNNLVHGNGQEGVYLYSGVGNVLENNTITFNGGHALRADSVSPTIRNNILWAEGAGNFALYRYNVNYWVTTSDFNLLYTTDGASVSNDEATLTAWQTATDNDLHSFSRDPLFVDASSGDFHLQSAAGSYHGGAWSADAATSPGVDTGHGDAGTESAANSTPLHAADQGQRNLGAYGGTEQGSKTPAGRQLWLLDPSGGEVHPALPQEVRWTWVGQAWASGDSVNLEHSADSGGTFSPISGAAAVPVEQGSFTWDISGYTPGLLNRLRATCNQDPAASDQSPADFQIRQPIIHYVNDASTAYDAWCTAIGDDANDGLTPASPKATVQAILGTYDLEPGDRVRIDTGTYPLASNIEVTAADEGDITAPVTFEASPYGVTLDGHYVSSDSYVWYLNHARYVTITTAASSRYPLMAQRWMKVTRAGRGVYAHEADHALIQRLEVCSNSTDGIQSHDSSFATFANNVIHDNGYGINLNYSDGNTIENNTIVFNADAQLYVRSLIEPATVRNNIFWANRTESLVFERPKHDDLPTSDYNLLYVTGGAGVCNFGALPAWRIATGNDCHSLFRDPLFVDAGFHLRSTAGSYHGGAWSADGATSPGIDAGYGDAGAEPAENSTPLHAPGEGQRNLGAYGGTEQASKTPAGRHLWLLEPAGAEVCSSSPQEIRWTWVGRGWQEGDSLRLEGSSDSGNTFHAIAGAAAVPIEAATFSWDISGYASGPHYRVRAELNQAPEVGDQTPADFRVRLGPVTYYVNDSSTENDAWCTAPGDHYNDGLTPATPRASVQAILGTYDLQPGDTVRIDTGSYVLSSSIEVTKQDQGDATAPVTFEASPYGVTIDRNSTDPFSGDAWYLNEAQYVTITTATSTKHPSAPQSWMKVTGGFFGVYFDRADYVSISRLEICSNEADGIRGDRTDYGTYRNNLIHGNGASGVYLTNCDESIVENNTIAFNGGAQLLSGEPATIRNNILWADGLYGCALSLSQSVRTSDYNLLHATGGASIARALGRFLTLDEWRAISGNDMHSLCRDPLFVDGASGDFHLQAGSPGIDTGYGDAGTEPAPNSTPLHAANEGQRNLGAYGGTEQGTGTPAGRDLWLLRPAADDAYDDASVSICWTWVGQGWQSGDSVNLEYSADSGATFAAIAGASAQPVEACTFAWDVSGFASSPLYRVRATSNQDGAATDTTPGDFLIRASGPITYYVNDASTSYDVWCTAIGNDANDGLTPATPKATVPAIVDTYNLEPGDTVRIDTGMYVLESNIKLSSHDQGDSTGPVTFEASPYGVTLDRNSTDRESYVWGLDQAEHVTITTAPSTRYPSLPQRWMKVTGGHCGVAVGRAYHASINRLEVCSNVGDGIGASGVEHGAFTNNLIHDNGSEGLYFSECDYTFLENNTVVFNQGHQLTLQGAGGPLAIRNNIFWSDGVDDHALDWSGANSLISDYNLLYATGGASLTSHGATLSEWQAASGGDEHSFSANPLFVDAAGGDFHLQSPAGSYHAGAWTADPGTSPGIDTGQGDAGWEPAPNFTPLHADDQGRRNLGAYGGTEQGSKTPVTRQLLLKEPIGGEVYAASTAPIRWNWLGQDWQSGDTLRLEYSADSGTTFSPIPGAAAVAVEAAGFSWDVSSVAPGVRYRVRLTSNEDSSAVGTSPADFQIRSALPMTFYVNDPSTVHDEWCTAVGDDANDGLTPATPKATVQAILSTWDLEPGDTVRIDTGTYTMESNIEVTSADEGDATAPVTFEASPYGVILDRNDTSSGSYAWHLNGADYVTIITAISSKYASVTQSWMKLTGASRGVYAFGANHATINRLEVYSNATYGIQAYGVSHGTYTNNLIHDNAYQNVRLSYCDDSTVENNTIACNSGTQLYIYRSDSVTVRNNILWADGADDYVVYQDAYSENLTSDYNLLYATGGATVSDLGASLALWREATGNDRHSLSRDPLFVDAAGGDFHLQSPAGSYHGGAWTADAATSPGIDTGYGDAAAELADNFTPLHAATRGQRNLGAYGGTEQGSRTPADRQLWLYEPIGGEVYYPSSQHIRWTWVGQAWQSDDTVSLASSPDSGTTWDAISPDAAVEAGTFCWDISEYRPGSQYRAKITPNEAPGVSDQSPADFRIRAIVYYVNDSSTDYDAWCTAIGDDANDGQTPATPKATVQAILAEYDIEPGDTIRIDTGYYAADTDIEVRSTDQGDSSAPVTFEGSPYGVTFDRIDSGRPRYVWNINSADYVTITTANSTKYPSVAQSWMKVTGGTCGVYVCRADYAVISRLEVCSNAGIGLYARYSNHGTYTNNLIHHNADDGIYLYEGLGSLVKDNTIALNLDSQLRVIGSGSSATVRNNILWADGGGGYALLAQSILHTSDFNLLYATNGAYISYRGEVCETLAAWQAASGKDANSISCDPLFADSAAGDFHLMSNAGRYDPSSGLPPYDGAAWVADGYTSPGIDRGDPGDAFANEPLPNGGRINLGAYGNTAQASKTTAGIEIQVDTDGVPVPLGGTADYGRTLPGFPLTKTFTVRNVGTDPLTLLGPITVPDGYTLVEGFGTTTLAKGEWTTFRLQLNAAVPGTVSGPVSFHNDDPDENPFSFQVTATVAEPLVVTTTDDVVDPDDGLLSLREAVTAANANGVPDLITSPAGTYVLSIPGAGGLGVTGDLILRGAGAATTIIDAAVLDGVFYVAGDANVHLSGVTITGGEAVEGGGIYIESDATLTITDSIVSGNSATNYGGGIYADSHATLTITDTIVSDNSADSLGGGIFGWLYADVTITGSTVSGNSAVFGGGVFSYAYTLTITRSTLSGNSARGGGGGIYTHSSAFTLTDSTVSGNSAGSSYQYAGGIFNEGDGATIRNSTISDNTGGIQNDAELSIENSIVAGNNDRDVQGDFNSLGYNLIGDGSLSTGFDGPGDQVGTSTDPIDPMLGPLRDNGGPTLTHAVLPGSPAIDAGDPDFDPYAFDPPLITDQCGLPRVVDGDGDGTARLDVGAFELSWADYGDAPAPYLTTLADGGPRHLAVGPALGPRRDEEADGLPSLLANGDDVDNLDDEDALNNPAADLALCIGAQPTVNVIVTNTTGSTATLYGWIDYNADGVFDNASERAHASVPDGTSGGIVTLTFPEVPEGFTGTTYARFRLSTDPAAADPTGLASDGEVEDYTATTTRRSSGTVKAHQKISDTEGGFTGTLDDHDWFGNSLANVGDLDGDGVTELAVGSRHDDDGGPGRGAVWMLFLNGDGTVKTHQKISATAGGFAGPLDDYDHFGASVASVGDLDGDGVTDLAVGADYDDDGGLERGAVWMLFLNADGTVKAHRKISDTEGSFTGTLDDNDRFGVRVASVGDLDGDGVTDLAVGAHHDGDGGHCRGAVWMLFLNADGTVKAHQKISDTAGNFTGTLDDADYFGLSVASVGDLDGDGVTDLAVGASDDDGGTNRGAVWMLFLNADGTVKAHQKISDTEGNFTGNLDDGDSFDCSLAYVGDLDGDGVADLAVGAHCDDDGGYHRGALWMLFLNADGTVKAHQKISDTEGNFAGALDDVDQFGHSMASVGDLDGDGVTDLASGAQLDDDGGDNRGAVWMLFLAPEQDYGDAPDGPYATLWASDGPRHGIVSNLFMGVSVDAETEALPSATADGDDNKETDDEDGLVDPAGDLDLLVGQTPTVDVKVTNNTGAAATLYGWIDYNGDGVFDNATERASIAVPDGTNDGTLTLTFPVVPAGSPASTYARFRLSTDPAAANPTGAASDGEVEDYPVVIDQAPQVTNVWVRGSGWTATFLNYLQASGVGDATHGYAIPVGSAEQLDTLPWINLDTIAIQFSEDVSVEQGDLELWGVNVTSYGFSGFSYAGNVATWGLADAIGPDKLRIDLDGDAGGVTDRVGNLLDGEWTDQGDAYPSGNGAPGGDFRFRFNVVPGDADRDTETRTPDWRMVRAYGGARAGDGDYSIFLDVDGDGEIRMPDWRATRAEGGNRLPVEEPGPSAPAPLWSPTAPAPNDLVLTAALDPAPVRLDSMDRRVGLSVWDEALLMIAAEDLDHGDDEEESPGDLMPALFFDFGQE